MGRVEFPLTSDRLLLRPFEPEDVPAAHVIYRDPEVMRWVGTGPVSRAEQTAAMLAGYIAHQRRHGFSFWAVIEQSTGTLIGDAGLYARAEHVELGYTLGRSHWGQGYGTEAAAACVHGAFDGLELEELSALVRPENAASLAVVGKLGFAEAGRIYAHGAPHIVFRLSRPPRAARAEN